MSATILWHPTDRGKTLGVGAPSSFKEAMEKVFGSFPLVLDQSAVERIRAMAAVARDEAYNDLADIIEQHGEIRLWAEY